MCGSRISHPARRAFSRKLMAEMKRPAARGDLDLLAALSHQASFTLSCCCEDESRCYRSILRALPEARGAGLRQADAKRKSITGPVTGVDP
jgi:hypothetical protein